MSYTAALKSFRDQLKQGVHIPVKQVKVAAWPNYHHGKVRDSYDLPNKQRLIITTDRQSAHDELWGYVPYKGMVLTQLSQFWFKQTLDICDNHYLNCLDPNVMLVKRVKMLAIEVVVRGYLTGSTMTSIWQRYLAGERNFNGLRLADGLSKNSPLAQVIVTPTSKAVTGHDETITQEQMITQGILTAAQWEQLRDISLKLFNKGQAVAKQRGLILVDTKYEFGLDEDNTIVLADEIHTPDSSRYWSLESYDKNPTHPDMLDKEVLRLWLREHNLTASKQALQPLLMELAARYLCLYEMLTGETVDLKVYQDEEPETRIQRHVNQFLKY